MARITISLPDHLNALLKDEARRRGVSVSEVVRDLVTEGLLGFEDKPREIPWAGIIDDPNMPQAADLEEYLAQTWADAIQGDRGK